MIKIGVLGAGHLGKIHIKLLKEIPAFELVGFYDPDRENSEAVVRQFGVTAFPSMEKLVEVVDAVDIITPTTTHYACATYAMKNSRHIFVEKPITSDVEDARKLVKMAREAKIKAQVGHVERFNPALLAVKKYPINPMFMEVHRLAQWNPRGTDVSVIHDLMIHDIDIVLSMVKSEVKKISASGVAVISDTPDIANARIEFNNGAVANLTASRISMKNMRKMRIFQKNSYLSIDFLDKKAEVFKIHDEGAEIASGMMKYEFESESRKRILTFENPKVEPVNSIKMELEEFARAIQDNSPTVVTLEEATNAMVTAQKIVEKINALCIN
ncbi:MAG: Gfo/Idh/MocA family oxidoreductase [Bacteroidia bacterium]|nr:Gfo/Idh/MocA family oxidoreductase [Bacteroidia bacterium]